MLRLGAIRARIPRTARLFSSSKDAVTVNVMDPSLDTKNFFKFQTGRWLSNDKQERDLRETKFSFKGLLEVLKQNCDYLVKTPAFGEFGMKTIEPFFEGKHHKLYKIQLNDMRCYILRIPYKLGHAKYREKRLLSEVATMDFLEKKHGMPLATPVSWCGTSENPLGQPYILMDYIAGEKLMKYWKPWSEDIDEKTAIIKPVVDFVDKLVSTTFNKYGGLYFIEDVEAKHQFQEPYNGETNKEFMDRWRVGPTAEKRFWKGDSLDVGAPFRGPWNTYQNYLDDTANLQLAYVKDALSRDPQNESLNMAQAAANRYKSLVGSLFPESEFSPEVYSPRLHHPEISPLEVICNEDMSKFYCIDFENTSIRPLMLHGVPWFARNNGERIYKKEDVSNYDKLSEAEKKVVEHYMRLTHTEFTYEYLFHKAKPTLFPSLNPGIKRREEVVSKALSVDFCTGFYNDLDFAIYKLSQLWPYLNMQNRAGFPVSYSEAELKQIGNDVEEWNAKVRADPTVETKGFMLARVFDQCLGEGKIEVKENGEYKLTPKFFENPQIV